MTGLTRWVGERTDAMSTGRDVDGGCSDTQHPSGRPGHGVTALSYDAAAVRARGGRAHLAWRAGGGRRQSDHGWLDRALRHRIGVARRAADAAADQRDVAGTR